MTAAEIASLLAAQSNAMSASAAEIAGRVAELEMERDGIAQRIRAVADEQCGMAIRTVDESLTAIEREHFAQRQRVTALEQGLLEACDCIAAKNSPNPYVAHLRKIASGAP